MNPSILQPINPSILMCKSDRAILYTSCAEDTSPNGVTPEAPQGIQKDRSCRRERERTLTILESYAFDSVVFGIGHLRLFSPFCRMSWNSGILAYRLSEAQIEIVPSSPMRNEYRQRVSCCDGDRHFAKQIEVQTMPIMDMPGLPKQASRNVATINAKRTLDLGGFETTFGTYMLFVRICSYLENITISLIFIAKMRF